MDYGDGPLPVMLRDGQIEDLSTIAPTTAHLLNRCATKLIDPTRESRAGPCRRTRAPGGVDGGGRTLPPRAVLGACGSSMRQGLRK